MSAKPIIDVAVRIPDLASLEAHRASLERAGWALGSSVRSHPVMVFEPDGRRTRIAHFFLAENWHATNQRLLRDWLIGHPADARRYEQVKMDAAAEASTSRRAYNARKTDIIQEIVDRARADHGLPAVDAHDK